MARTTLLSFIIILTILGLADAWYLADTALTGTALTCNIAGLDGCNTVAKSVYAHLFGVPLGVYGVVFYVVFLITAGFARMKPSRRADRVLALLALLGTLASIAFLYIQFVLIKAVCVYCLGSAVIAFLLAACVAWLYHGLKTPEVPVAIS